jgi:formylglycine-generating enzyme required for sulfatase activity
VAVGISLKGIDEAIASLKYRNANTLKSRLVHAVRCLYENEGPIESVEGINAEKLIKALWDTDAHPATIKAKRKNFSSIKSSINADLRKLYKEGKNPEGIIIGRNNVFALSDEAKDKLLATFKNAVRADGSVTLNQIAEVLDIINEVLSAPGALSDADSSHGPRKLEALGRTIQGLSEKLGLEGTQDGLSGQASEDGQGPDVVESGADLADEAEVEEVVTEEAESEPEEVEDMDGLEEAEVEAAPQELGQDDGPDAPEEARPEQGVDQGGVGEDLEDAEQAEDLQEVQTEDDLEDLETDEPVDEVVLEEDLDEAEVEEALEEIEVEVSDDLEEIEEAEALGEVDTDEGLDEGGHRGGTDVEVPEGPAGVGLPVGSLGQDDPDSIYDGDDKIQKANLLAEAFDGYLGTMERFYNQYVLIPEAEYIVGSKAPKRDEQPEHRVKLGPFYMGKFPVTNALFEIFVEKTGYTTTAEKLGHGTVYYGRFHEKMDQKTGLIKYTFNATVRDVTVNGACWYQPFGPGSTLHQKRNHPVVQVSLEDAMAFAAWTGKRLPTENEWEAAARTADGRVFPWGNEWKSSSCNIEESSVADTVSVDTYVALENDFGIVDTLGNVLEWTLDTYEAPHNAKNSPRRQIAKGGSWISGNDIRPCSRFKVDPAAPANIIGFRCVAY